MGIFKVLIVLTIAVAASAQYSYPKPTTTTRRPPPPPPVTYLPPPTPYRSYQEVAAPAIEPEHKVGDPFAYTYSVKDTPTVNDYSHQVDSKNDVVKGEYRTLMPDGRTQIVRYTASWKDGYNAQVSYQ